MHLARMRAHNRPMNAASPAAAVSACERETARFEVYASILHDIGSPMAGRVLDFGCGDGRLIRAALRRGLDAYGCDFEGQSFIRTRHVLDEMKSAGRLLPIQNDPYHLPFEDNTFDVAISDQVFEHVQDYDQALAELARVLKPGGCCLHLFPSRARLIEGHMLIPFGGMFRPRWWVAAWAYLGVRNRYQLGKNARAVIEENIEWLPARTNYLTGPEIRAHFDRHFSRVVFAERYFLRYSRRLSFMRLAPALYRVFVQRVIYAMK